MQAINLRYKIFLKKRITGITFFSELKYLGLHQKANKILTKPFENESIFSIAVGRLMTTEEISY